MNIALNNDQALSLLSLLVTLWVLPWKGIALWKAANRKEKWWFIALFIVNTLGILEIVYIFYYSTKPLKKK